MTETLKIGLAGLGTVGVGVIRVLDENRALIARRAGRPIKIVAVSARNRGQDRGVGIQNFAWEDDPVRLAQRDDVDAVVELIGGSDGPALALARATLGAGKPLITANKAMIAHHGLTLAERAEAGGVALKYEAAVAGGIPVIKGLREGTAANQLSRVYGILNGTCNYILSTMEARGLGFDEALAEAQAQGFAEADPSTDVDGIDAAHKLAILASLAFGTRLDFAHIHSDGIRAIGAADVEMARSLGYCLRLVGLASWNPDGALYQAVQPCLVPLDHPLARVNGAMNAVVAEGNFVGRLLFEGRGAGEGPTASAVVADLIDVARGEVGPAFAMPVAHLEPARPIAGGDRAIRAYLRLRVKDRPGVLAEIATAMRDADVSIESLIQKGEGADHDVGAGDAADVLVVMTTHRAPRHALETVLARLAKSAHVSGPAMLMPILND